MNELRIFENPEFGSIRTVEVNGEPWFVGKDVAEILGYEKPTDSVRKRAWFLAVNFRRRRNLNAG